MLTAFNALSVGDRKDPGKVGYPRFCRDPICRAPPPPRATWQGRKERLAIGAGGTMLRPLEGAWSMV